MRDNEIIFPNYKHSILNLTNSILKYYGVETKYSGLPKLDEKLQEEYKNIVLIILDGMGEHILNNALPNGFFYNNKIDTITSVTPSTTTAAMTTYFSGKPPIETGWVAMSQYFKEYGRTIEMLKHIDSYTGEKISNTRMDVYDLVKYTPIYEQIEKASPDVKAYEINPTYCDARSKRNINADNIELACDAVKSICENKDRNFILVYDDNPDGLLHNYGCKSGEVCEFLYRAENAIKNMCEELKDTNTLVIVSADHGHKDIENDYNILDMKEIQDCLIMPASLESRCISFCVKEEKKQEFQNYFRTKLQNEFILYTKEEFIENNLLGNGQKHPKIDDFLGDYIAIAIGSSRIRLGTYLGKEKKEKRATHCGLTPNEMEVPLIVI